MLALSKETVHGDYDEQSVSYICKATLHKNIKRIAVHYHNRPLQAILHIIRLQTWNEQINPRK